MAGVSPKLFGHSWPKFNSGTSRDATYGCASYGTMTACLPEEISAAYRDVAWLLQ